MRYARNLLPAERLEARERLGYEHLGENGIPGRERFRRASGLARAAGLSRWRRRLTGAGRVVMFMT
ncbi:hypothetical protein [Calidithermus terrae]|uniref:hypothetical protein n=1 Tax=Calidithermus terrae TaxID=1408545 RepID=UPI000E65613C|nr:hypothetical protein [Calidithermus terrae]